MKTFTGTVIKTKMNKTAVVEVERLWMHPLYKKRVKRTKKYLIHDEKNEAQVNDQVVFAECLPISKRKRFKLVEIIKE